MSPKDRWSRRPWIAALIFAILAGLTVLIFGQQRGQMANPQSSMNVPILSHGPQEDSMEVRGYPDDWSFHHLNFTDPGTEEDAIREGRHEQWLRIVNEPRYIIQQLKRRQPAQGPYAELVARMNGVFQNREADAAERLGVDRLGEFFNPVKGHRPVRPVKSKISRDWSMNLGAFVAATGTGTVTTNNAGHGSTFSVNGQTFTAYDPTAAAENGTFTASPTNNQTLKITNPNPTSTSITLTASVGAAGTQTGTVGALPTMSGLASNPATTVVNSKTGNTLTLSTTATAANVLGTFANDPTNSTGNPSVTITNGTAKQTTLALASGFALPSATAAFTGVPTSGDTITIASGIQTMTLTATTRSGGNTGTIQVNTAAPSTSDTLTITTAGFGTVTYTFSTSSSTCAATPNCIYAPTSGNTIQNMAKNIRAAINARASQCGDPSGSGCIDTSTAVNPYVTAGSASSCTGNSYCITLTNESYQAVTLGETGTSSDFTISGSPISATSSGCTSATTGTFVIGTGALGSAENLYGAINLCNGSYSVIGTSASSFNSTNDSFTVSETTYGTSSSTTPAAFAESASNFTWTTIQAGSVGTANGCSGSGPYTASYQAAPTLLGLAQNAVSAINQCTSTSNPIYAVVGSNGQFTVYNNVLGTSAGTVSDSPVSGLLTWGSAVAGSTGAANTCDNTTGSFQVVNGATVANVATALVATINACGNATTGLANNASNSSATITVTSTTWAASTGMTLSPTSGGFFNWAGSTITGTSGSSTGTNFPVDNVPADIASALAAAITTNGSTVGVGATSSAAEVIITASTAGSFGNSIGVTNGLTGITLASTLSGGGDGTNSSNSFAYWYQNALASPTQLAQDIAAAINDNTSTGVTVVPSTGGSNGIVTVTAGTNGSSGNSIATTPAPSFSGFTWGGATLSGGANAGLGPGQYPAKFNVSTTGASCTDYVVYPTGAVGTSGQPTILAYTNLYGTSNSTGCGANSGGYVPQVYWAYNAPVGGTYGTATLSPVIDWSGTQVAFVENVTVSSTTTSYLVLLRMPSPSKASGAVTTPTYAGANGGSAYSLCSAPCYTTFSLSATDSNSSPFYDYTHDVLYVGDDVGIVHQFKSFFGGPPSVGWTSATVGSTRKLTGPVVDPNSPGLIFFGDSSGYLHSLTTSGGTAVTAEQNDCGTAGFTDAPLIDSAYTTSYVYVFVSYGCDTPSHSYINAYDAATTISGTYGPYDVQVGAPSTGQKVYVGAFDNQHNTSNNGNLYVCMGDTSTGTEPTLYQVGLGTGGGGNPSLTLHTYNSTSNGAGTCSPVTEFLGTTAGTKLTAVMTSSQTTASVTSGTNFNTNDYIQIDSEIMKIAGGGGTTTLTVTRAQLGTSAASHTNNAAVSDIHDWLYLSVSANGSNMGGCSGACLYNFDATSGASSRSATTGLGVTGGASAVIVDNNALSLAGASEIYFSSQGSQTCLGNGNGNGTTGSGSGGCAVQASQSAP